MIHRVWNDTLLLLCFVVLHSGRFASYVCSRFCSLTCLVCIPCPLSSVLGLQALAHPYFTTLPSPCAPADLPVPAGVVLPPPHPATTAAAGAGAGNVKKAASMATGASAISLHSSNNSLVDKVTALEVAGAEAAVEGGEEPPHKKVRNV